MRVKRSEFSYVASPFVRYFSTEYLASYRSLTATYYPEYAASAHAAAGYIGNGYFDVTSPRSALTSIPYDAASQFNRYFEADKVDCKYNPNSESPKSEFQQQPAQPPQPQQQHPNSGKDHVVKPDPDFENIQQQQSAEDQVSTDQVVVDLHQFVSTTTANQIFMVCSRCRRSAAHLWHFIT